MVCNDQEFNKVLEFLEGLGWIRKDATGWTNGAWWNRKRIGRGSRIEEDIGCTGDDMEELMVPFFETFGVSPVGFVPARYFHGEGLNAPVLTPVMYFVLNRKTFPPGPTYDLTIGDLVECVRAGKWIDPPEAPEWKAPETSFREVMKSVMNSLFRNE